MKWLKRLLLGGLLLILLLLAAAGVLVGTRPGTGWLVQLAERFTPGELKVANAEGTLLGDLRLSGVEYASPDMKVSVGELVLGWLPRELGQRRLHIRELSARQVRYEALTEAPEDDEPLVLPELKLPVEIRIDGIALEAMELVTAPGSEPLTIDSAGLAADWTNEGVKLTTLALRMPQVSLDGSGHVQPVGDYPLDLQLQWKLHMEGQPKVAGKGGLSGDLKKLGVKQLLSGDLAASLEATLSDLLRKPGWDARVSITRLPEAYLGGEAPRDLKIDLRSTGDLEQARVSLKLAATPEENGEPMRLDLQGEATLGDRKFHLQGAWDRLQWPLAGVPRVVAETGSLKADGVPDDYRFNLETKVLGSDLPDGDWEIRGSGNLDQAVFEGITGRTLEGVIRASGKVAWKDGLGWDLQASAEGIDPGGFLPEWPGRLDLDLASRASSRNGRLQMEAELKKLEGVLNDKPVAGSGRFRMAGDEVRLEQVVLRSGQARVEADGRLGKAWDLGWKLEVPDLGDLLPAGQGAVQGSGSLSGSADRPVVKGRLTVRELSWQGTRVASSDADFALGLDPAFDSRAVVTGSGMDVAGQAIDSLNLSLDGPIDDHRIRLALKHELGDLQLEATGGYLSKEAAWKGELGKLSLVGEQLGNWQLREASKLALSEKEVSVSPLCLVDGQASLCLEADRFPDKGSADLNLEGLSMERLRPLLPPEIEEFTGVLAARAHADLSTPVKANLEATLAPGVLSYLDPDSRPVRLEHRNGKVTATYDEKQLAAHWNIELGQHDARGDLFVPRQALDTDPMAAPLKGDVQLAITELGLVQAFVPEIEKIDGKVDVALKLAGTLGNPAVTGHATLDAGQVLVPVAGLDLRDILIQALGSDGRTLKLTGRVRSGEGDMALGGVVTLDEGQGWPARVTLKGKDFQLANIPEAQVVVSSDVQLENNRELTKVRGKLDVQKAIIEIHDLPPNSRDVSPDVVIVGEEPEAGDQGGARLDAEVQVTLGDRVHFAGFGLKVDLGGQLTVRMKGSKSPTANGELKILSGSYRAYGQDLTIDKGRISWAGGNIANPILRLQASRRIDGVTVGVRVSGTAKKPEFKTFSTDPDVTEKEALTMLVTGQKSDNLAHASIYAGRQITPDLSVGVNLGGGDRGTEFVARYRLRRNVNLEGTSSSKKSGVSINYTFEIE